jgi:hypothetical protein
MNKNKMMGEEIKLGKSDRNRNRNSSAAES